MSRCRSLAAFKVNHRTQAIKDIQFIEATELGVSRPKRCDPCKNCTRCSHRAETMFRRDASERVQIEQAVTTEECVASIKNPTKGDLNRLKNNTKQAIAYAAALEKKQDRDETREIYNAEIDAFLEKGVFQVAGQGGDGQVGKSSQLLSPIMVFPSKALSTALRVVNNSSLKNSQSGGLPYNDLLMKGPNFLIPLIQVQANLRTLPYVVVWDYAKAYISVHTLRRRCTNRGWCGATNMRTSGRFMG